MMKYQQEYALQFDDIRHKRLETLKKINLLIDEIDKSQHVVNIFQNGDNSMSLKNGSNLKSQSYSNFEMDVNLHDENLNINSLLFAEENHITNEDKIHYQFPITPVVSCKNIISIKNNEDHPTELINKYKNTDLFLNYPALYIKKNSSSSHKDIHSIDIVEMVESIDSGFQTNRTINDSECNLEHINQSLKNIQNNLKNYPGNKKCTRNVILSNLLNCKNESIGLNSVNNETLDLEQKLDINSLNKTHVPEFIPNEPNITKSLNETNELNIYLLLSDQDNQVQNIDYKTKKLREIKNNVQFNNLEDDVINKDAKLNASICIKDACTESTKHDLEINSSIHLDSNSSFESCLSTIVNKNIKEKEYCEINSATTLGYIKFDKINNQLFGLKQKISPYLNLMMKSTPTYCSSNLNAFYMSIEYLDLANFEDKHCLKNDSHFQILSEISGKKILTDINNVTYNVTKNSEISSIYNQETLNESMSLKSVECTKDDLKSMTESKYEHMERFLKDLNHSYQHSTNDNDDNNLYISEAYNDQMNIDPSRCNLIEDPINLPGKITLTNAKDDCLNISLQVSPIAKKSINHPAKNSHKKNKIFIKTYEESVPYTQNKNSNIYCPKDENTKYVESNNTSSHKTTKTMRTGQSKTMSPHKTKIFLNESNLTKLLLNNSVCTSSNFGMEEFDIIKLNRLEKKLELMKRQHKIQMEQLLINQEQEQLLLQQEILLTRQRLVKKKQHHVNSSANKSDEFTSPKSICAIKDINEMIQRNANPMHQNNILKNNSDTPSLLIYQNDNTDSVFDISKLKDSRHINIDNEINISTTVNDHNLIYSSHVYTDYLEEIKNEDINDSFVTNMSQSFTNKFDEDNLSINKNGDKHSNYYLNDPKILMAGKVLFNKLGALIRGFLTRRIIKSNRVQYLIQTIKDSAALAQSIQQSSSISADDEVILDRVDKQLTSALYDFHEIFFEFTISDQMNIIMQQKLFENENLFKAHKKAEKPIKRLTSATIKFIKRKERNLLDNKENIGRNEIEMKKHSPIVKSSKTISKSNSVNRITASNIRAAGNASGDMLSSCSSSTTSVFNLKHLQQTNLYCEGRPKPGDGKWINKPQDGYAINKSQERCANLKRSQDTDAAYLNNQKLRKNLSKNVTIIKNNKKINHK